MPVIHCIHYNCVCVPCSSSLRGQYRYAEQTVSSVYDKWSEASRVLRRCFLSKRNNIYIGWRRRGGQRARAAAPHKSNAKGITLALHNSETFPGISKVIRFTPSAPTSLNPHNDPPPTDIVIYVWLSAAAFHMSEGEGPSLQRCHIY